MGRPARSSSPARRALGGREIRSFAAVSLRPARRRRSTRATCSSSSRLAPATPPRVLSRLRQPSSIALQRLAQLAGLLVAAHGHQPGSRPLEALRGTRKISRGAGRFTGLEEVSGSLEKEDRVLVMPLCHKVLGRPDQIAGTAVGNPPEGGHEGVEDQLLVIEAARPRAAPLAATSRRWRTIPWRARNCPCAGPFLPNARDLVTEKPSSCSGLDSSLPVRVFGMV